jgi:aspartate/methionine/tyrosine aminotransferase
MTASPGRRRLICSGWRIFQMNDAVSIFDCSTRMREVQSPIIPIVGALVRRHPGTISLGQGMVWYGPPGEVSAALHGFGSDPDHHRYQAVEGIPALIASLETKLDRENRIATGAEAQIVVTAGGNMAFINAVLAVADPGDEIILPAPFYFNHEMAIAMIGCRAIIVPTDADYQLSPEAIIKALTPRTRAVVTVSPNNPTGAVYREADLRAVNDLCRERGIFHISDEAYEYFTYDGARHFSPGSIRDAAAHTISLFSLSKSYGMASWRIGYMVIPARLTEAVRKIQDTILICPPVISQHAAIGALAAGPGYPRQHLAALSATRALIREKLNQLREICRVPTAGGAFYYYLDLETALDPLGLVERLIREYGVAAIPGTAFGDAAGCHLRISYGALRPETVQEGVGRLVAGLGAILRA